jgi:3-isopropylmalate dehydrogenase
VVAEGVKILKTVADKFGHTFQFTEALVGGAALDETGHPLPDESLAACREADAVLLGAVGAPKWSDPKAKVRPEQGLLRLRKELALFANLRPVKMFPGLVNASTLKKEVVASVDMVIVRELTGGLYFGRPQGRQDNEAGRAAVDTLSYTEAEIERLMRVAFELARQRRRKVTSVDKANVLASSRLWREVAHEVAADYPDVVYEDILVDACAMYLIRRPAEFDVIATENMFGDILSDEASVIAGSMGLLPSSSIGLQTSMYEPIHGSFPQAAGENIANPMATILSAAMMIEDFGMDTEAEVVRAAVRFILEKGMGTPELKPANPMGCSQVGDLVAHLAAEEEAFFVNENKISDRISTII